MATLHLVKTSPRAGGGEAACRKTLKLEFQLRTKDANKYFCYFILSAMEIIIIIIIIIIIKEREEIGRAHV